MPLVTLVLELELISSLLEYSPLQSSETGGVLKVSWNIRIRKKQTSSHR
jgi:hypothetical protein